MNVPQYLAASAGCREEFYRHLPADLEDAYNVYWYDAVELVKLLLYLGISEQELQFHADNLLLPHNVPRSGWDVARNFVQEHACCKYLRRFYPLESIAPLIIARLGANS